MAFLRASFHATAQADRAPEDIVSSMNKSLSRAATPGKFATFFLAMISVKDKRLRFCNGGHNSPYILSNGTLRELAATGIPLAITEFGPYTGGEETFQPGDTLVIFSDGIPEARVGRDFYGDDRLQKKALELAASGIPAKEFADRILTDVQTVAGEGMKADDVTLVVVRNL
jgi:sigma-B regulation protein RsbU (phosphoserine phosphatase)